MFIILSQKVDMESAYHGDEVFKTYHYPRRYRNQIHTGDIFIYYQGDRYNKLQRYYFGTGVIGKIWSENDEDFYAELNNVVKFVNKVPNYHPDGGYVESLGYSDVRNSVNPPWQSSIRPLSEKAYKYIIQNSGIENRIEELNVDLKNAILNYFIGEDIASLHDIIRISNQILDLKGV